jgi:hypothetical protein
MTRAIASLILGALLMAPAMAWEVEPRHRVRGEPEETTGAIEAAVIRCRQDLVIGVITPKRRLRPERDFSEEEALFDDIYGKVEARIDGRAFELGAVGASDEATIYIFPRRPFLFLEALHDAQSLELAFDILPERARGGAGFETTARFDTEGLTAALREAGRSCVLPPVVR